MLQQVLIHGPVVILDCLFLHRLDRPVQVNSVPLYDGGGHEIEATCSVALVLETAGGDALRVGLSSANTPWRNADSRHLLAGLNKAASETLASALAVEGRSDGTSLSTSGAIKVRRVQLERLLLSQNRPQRAY